MKILYLNDQVFPISDTDGEQIVSMVSALGAAGAEVELLLPRNLVGAQEASSGIAAYYQVAETFSVTVKRSFFPTVRAFEKVSHPLWCLPAIGRSGADVLYTRNLPTVAAALYGSGIPVVYETYRPWSRQVRGLIPLLRNLVRHPRLAGVVTHSRLAGDSFREVGLEAGKLLVSHNGYSPGRMEPVLSREEGRAQCGLDGKKRIVAYAGHISPEKGLGAILDMARSTPEARFLLVGSKGEGEIETLAADMDNVDLIPWQPFDKTVPYLYAADVLLIPPTAGPLERVGNTVLPMKTFLYLAAGRAILAPSTPDLTEVLKDGENAVLVMPDRRGAAVKALKDLLNNRRKMESLGEAALETARGKTWLRRAEGVLEFIDGRIRSMK